MGAQIQKDGLSALFTEGIPTLIGFNQKDNRDYNVHHFSNDTKNFILDNQLDIKMPQKIYQKNGDKKTMTPDEYKDFLTKIDKDTENIISDLKAKGEYVIRGKEIVELPYSKLTQKEIQDITKERITKATTKIRKEKFKTDEQTDEQIELKGLEKTLNEIRAANAGEGLPENN